MSKITVTEYAKALHLALHESKPENLDTVINNLVSLMREHDDLAHYEAVIAEYETLFAKSGAVKEVEAVFAKQTTANQGLLNELNTLIGTELEIRSKVDSELVGGMILRVDDKLIDASVKGQLGRLKTELTK